MSNVKVPAIERVLLMIFLSVTYLTAETLGERIQRILFEVIYLLTAEANGKVLSPKDNGGKPPPPTVLLTRVNLAS